MSDFKVGDKVRVLGNGKWSRLGPWTVIKVNPTTYKLQNAAGTRLNAAYGMVAAEDTGEKSAYDSATGSSTYTPPQRPPGFRLGQVVTFPVKPPSGFTMSDLFVIIADKQDMLNVVPLGGDEAHPLRYFRASWRMLQVAK